MDWLAMLQFAIGATTVLGVGVWLLYLLFIRPACGQEAKSARRPGRP